jgi:hypothetical protein
MEENGRDRMAAMQEGLERYRASGQVPKRRNRVETHTIRTMTGTAEITDYRALHAIRYFCTECLGWDGNAKTDCTDPLCPLFPFRGRRSPRPTP